MAVGDAIMRQRLVAAGIIDRAAILLDRRVIVDGILKVGYRLTRDL